MMRLTGVRRPKLLLGAALVALATAVGSAYGNFGGDANLQFGPDAAFKATFTAHASRDDGDLHDGRSRVPARWRTNFERFAQSDRERRPADGGIVFVGSSSIDFWNDIQAQFPTYHVVQRGLPGATIADCTRSVDRLILPYKPRVIVFYAGDNDLAAGVSPDQVVADYTELVRQVHRDLPAARLVFVSIKPSPSRAALMPLIRRTNALMAAYAGTDRRLDFVNVFDAMLDRESHARLELFRADGLHMTAIGYTLWHDAIVAHLD
jgi:lysophospholipase L1-like esterase